MKILTEYVQSNEDRKKTRRKKYISPYKVAFTWNRIKNKVDSPNEKYE